MSVRINFKLRSEVQYHVATFDHEPSVPMMRAIVADKFRMKISNIYLFHDDKNRNGRMYKDDERLSSSAKVIVRTSSENRLPTLGDVPREPDAMVVDTIDVLSESEEARRAAMIEDTRDVLDICIAEAAAIEEAKATEALAALEADMIRIRSFSCADGQLGNPVANGSMRRQPPRVCSMCRKGGHWKSDCPAKNDPSLLEKRLHRPSGIPADMLFHGCGGGLVASDGQVCSMVAHKDAFFAATANYRPLPEDPRFAAARRMDELRAAGDMRMQILDYMPAAFLGGPTMSLAAFEVMFYECDGPSWCAGVLKGCGREVDTAPA